MTTTTQARETGGVRVVEHPTLAPYGERYAWEQDGYRPLLVTLRLMPGSVLAGYDPLCLAGMLARAVVQDALPDGRLPDTPHAYALPVPLKPLWHGPGGLPLWAATPFWPAAGALPEAAADTVYRHKRSQPGRYTGTKSGAFSIRSTSGRWQERRVPVPASCAETWMATAVGDPAEITRLLAPITHAGKERARGCGEVARWEVAPLPGGFSLTGIRETEAGPREYLLRSLPVECLALIGNRVPPEDPAPVAWTPPAWKVGLYRPGWWPGTLLPAAPVDWYAEAGAW